MTRWRGSRRPRRGTTSRSAWSTNHVGSLTLEQRIEPVALALRLVSVTAYRTSRMRPIRSRRLLAYGFELKRSTVKTPFGSRRSNPPPV